MPGRHNTIFHPRWRGSSGRRRQLPGSWLEVADAGSSISHFSQLSCQQELCFPCRLCTQEVRVRKLRGFLAVPHGILKARRQQGNCPGLWMPGQDGAQQCLWVTEPGNPGLGILGEHLSDMTVSGLGLIAACRDSASGAEPLLCPGDPGGGTSLHAGLCLGVLRGVSSGDHTWDQLGPGVGRVPAKVLYQHTEESRPRSPLQP